MTKPGDPQKGKAAETEQAEVEAKDAAEAKGTKDAAQAAEAPKPKRGRRKKAEAAPQAEAPGPAAEAPAPDEVVEQEEPAEPQAEGTAAAETGVDKQAAEAVTDDDGEPAKPKRRARRRRGEDGERRRGEQRQVDPTLTVRAQARFVRSSARKARLVCDTFRGKPVPEARSILAFSPRGVSRDWLKVLESAVANAEHNHELVGDELRVAAAYADEGPTLKRYRPRAMGRATRIRKRTSHLTIALMPMGTKE